MSVPPSLPPRRVPPPPRTVGSSDAETAPIPTGIAARIANLHLDHLVRNPFGHSHLVKAPSHEEEVETYQETNTYDQAEESADTAYEADEAPPPPLPPRSTRPKHTATSPHLTGALSRKPPPPPAQSAPDVPRSAITNRRVPPPPAQRNIPPPKPEEPEEGTVNGQGDSCIKCRDFSHVDDHASRFPRRTVKSLDNLAYDLTEPFPSETEKARAIFTWLHHNVAYDAESYFSGDVKPATPEFTLASGLAVCEGYAGLFKYLAERVGLQVMTVSGHGKGYGYVGPKPNQPTPEMDSNHAWNCVQMDEEWHLIDCCWGAGILEGTTYNPLFAPMWFTSTPSEFGRRHFPTDPGYQLISDEDGGPVSWKDYILAPEGPLLFQDFYKLDLVPDLVQPATKNIEGNRRVSFHVWKRCEHMSTSEADNYVTFIATSDDKRTPMEVNAEGGWSAAAFVPRGGEVFLYYVSKVDGRDAKGLGVAGFRNADGRKAMSFGGCCQWTVA
jgi:transglutaminase-like putative cysteine protease